MRQKPSIKWKLILLFTTISTLPVFILGAVVLHFAARGLENEINAKNLILSEIFIHQAEKYLEDPLKDLDSLGKVITAHGFSSHTDLLFEELIERHHYFIKFILTDRDGYVSNVFPYDGELVGSDLSRQEFYKQLMNTGGSYWSSVFISSPDNIPVTALSVKIADSILTAHLNLGRLSEITGKLSKTKNIVVSVTDQTGTYIAHSDIEKVLRRDRNYSYNLIENKNNEEVIRANLKHDGVDYVCHIGFIRQTGWSVMISQPYGATYLPVKRLFWSILLFTFVIFSSSFLISYRFGSVLKKYIDLFLENTRRIAGGEYTSKISGLQYAEFSELAESISGMAQRIHDREQDILESQAIFRAVFHADAIGASLINSDLNFRIVNRKWSEITGYSMDELDSHSILSLTHPDDRDESESILFSLLKGEATTARHEKRVVHKSGKVIWVDHTLAYVDKGGREEYLVGMMIDNTEEKLAQAEKEQLERRLQQAYKMEAVGSLAGGIAHDFNNILSAILGYAELAIEETPEDSQVAAFLSEVEKASHRAKELVKQILAFSRQTEVEFITIKPETVIYDALKMIRPSIPASIEIYTQIETDTGVVRANPAQLHQVILNLCTNSFHALEKTGGSLTIKLRKERFSGNEFFHVSKTESDIFVRLTVHDSGPGISDVMREKIFDPYFTTKEFGKGTGMGLSIAHGIISKHGGVLLLDEDVVSGASFSVYLPLLDEKVEDTKDLRPAMLHGSERILMVDDEVMLTEMGRDMLEKIGYTVTACNDSKQAVDLFLRDPEAFDLVVTDQTMPKMTGLELAKHFLQVRPELPIILCTGFSSLVDRDEALAAGIKDFLYKPVKAVELSMRIRAVLADSANYKSNNTDSSD